jgi:hypothetical protein
LYVLTKCKSNNKNIIIGNLLNNKEKIKYFVKKPVKGGIPDIDKIKIVNK